jgi:uncharacterized protein (DUF952 family)
VIYFLTTRDEWEAVAETGLLAAPGTDPFVHCCDESQIAHVHSTYFAARPDVVALGLDPTRLDAETRYEPGSGGEAQRFPHVYGPIHRADVIDVRPLSR